MIKFIQKQYSEYDAMKALYEELKKDYRNCPEIIGNSALIPILKGNNIVIERFVISDSMFGRDKYRMYLKIGAKAKLPDKVKLARFKYDQKKLGDLNLSFKSSIPKYKLFSKNKNNNNESNFLNTEFKPYLSITKDTKKILGTVLDYNIQDRSLVLEFDEIWDAIQALKILPFGINYKIYLLDA